MLQETETQRLGKHPIRYSHLHVTLSDRIRIYSKENIQGQLSRYLIPRETHFRGKPNTLIMWWYAYNPYCQNPRAVPEQEASYP